MSKQVIKTSLNSADLDKAIRELHSYTAWVKKKTKELVERLAMVGASEASVRFASAIYDGENDAHVTVEPIKNGWMIRAQGNSVFFIEFGAGVYYNTDDPYPGGRPDGVAGIGEYGQGKGKGNTWGYYDTNGDLVLTHGNPAAMPMYYAGDAMDKAIRAIAKEVFG